MIHTRTAVSGPKPGKKSTEFWGKTILQLVLVINAMLDLGIAVTPAESMQIAAALEAVYTLARGYAKRGTTAEVVVSE